MGTIIWRKVTNTNTTGGAVIMGSFPYPRNGIVKIDYEYILLFKKPGKCEPPPKAVKETAALTSDEWNEYFSGHWCFGGERQSAHLAAFSKELPHRLIRMFTFPGEAVLDPFAGSGTTAIAAAELGRNSIGCELNRDFEPVIRDRFATVSHLFDAPKLIFERGSEEVDCDSLLAALPYQFADPHSMGMKIDARKFRFGSKVQDSDKRGNRAYKITAIEDGRVIVLDTGLRVVPKGLSATKLPISLVDLNVRLVLNGGTVDDSGAVSARVLVGDKDLKAVVTSGNPVADVKDLKR